MIIGISGKIGSGKDTIGTIIQYLTAINKHINSKEIDLKTDVNLWLDKKYAWNKTGLSGWEIKKFAGKLKQVICLLTGCTLEQLESSDFKDSELGKNWSYKVCDFDGNRVFTKSGACKECLDTKDIVEHFYTYRELLQKIGTDALRNIIHENIWVNALFADYYALNPEKRASMGNVLDYSACDFPNWIITDMRFPNEYEAVKSRKGITIRVNRVTSFVGDAKDWKKSEHIHPSETALDNTVFDYTIDNSGTIEELIERVRDILIKEKII